MIQAKKSLQSTLKAARVKTKIHLALEESNDQISIKIVKSRNSLNIKKIKKNYLRKLVDRTQAFVNEIAKRSYLV